MEILILVLLTLLNAFFAVSETALISVKKGRMELLASRGDKNAKKVLTLIENPESFLSSIQVGITLIGIVSGAYGGATLTDDVEKIFYGISFLRPHAYLLALIIVIGGITYFSIVVGELVPKSLAINNAEKISLFCAPIIRIISIVGYPFVKVLSISTNFILKIAGIKGNKSDVLSEDELRLLLKKARKQGVLEKEEQQVHDNIFSFTDRQAKSLMTHYSDLDWIDINNPMNELHDFLQKSTHSKLPVCNHSVDKLKGYIVATDFWKEEKDTQFLLQQIIREPIYITESSDAFTILNIFKAKKEYIGFVLDEYGIFKGLITLHDLMEAIVGNLPEDDDRDDGGIIPQPDGSFLIDGTLPVSELNQHFQHQLIDENPHYTTVAGFLLYELENFPFVGEEIIHKDMQLKVINMDGVRIDKIELSFNP